eukprot:CAMPEP_0179185480 /NCGR_PEP_ID=MMETSP0796-20121207/91975_1 /TAXON_ID=73915 /ORGANISM="Pyrodinium bahamense, Strain pbaha01" /LENGTH=36 /DNA_ID= /DNA_START= /DNA_END= /DNA_ORIENTATION=
MEHNLECQQSTILAPSRTSSPSSTHVATALAKWAQH